MQPLPAELDQPAALHGLSAFTTIRTRHGRALLLTQHLARLASTCAFLGLPEPELPKPRLPEPRLPELEALPWGLLRLTVTQAGTFWSHRPLPASIIPSSGVEVLLGSFQVHPQLGVHKTGNYLPYVLARREAQAQGAFEGLLTDALGNVVDGSRSGLLLKLEGRWVLPNGGLPSVARAAWLAELGVDSSIQMLSVERLRQAEHVWLCGSGTGIVPIRKIGGDGWAKEYAVHWPTTQHPALVIPS